MDPEDLILNKRHTKVLGTFTRKNDPKMMMK